MLGWLEHEHGLAREPAYVLMSVAVELRVSELVDAPNALVSAALPLDVFEDVTVRRGGPPRQSRVAGEPRRLPVPSSPRYRAARSRYARSSPSPAERCGV